MPAEELAKLVGISASTARRFVREARGLRLRLAPGDESSPLDVEEVPEFLASESQAAPMAVQLDQRDMVAKEKMLAAPVMDSLAEPAREQTFAEAAPKVEQPTEVAVEVSPMEAGAVDGLDEGLIEILGGNDVLTLWDLAEMDAGIVARATGVPYGLLTRLRFLARRENPEAPSVMEEAEAVLPEPLAMQADPLDLEPAELESVDRASLPTETETETATPAMASAPVFVPPTAYEQPVPIEGDPTQRPPFWEARAPRQVMDQGRRDATPTEQQGSSPSPKEAEQPQETVGDGETSPSGTTLGWDFQVPTPPGYKAPTSYPPVHLPQAAPPRADPMGQKSAPSETASAPAGSPVDGPDEGIGGPFA